MPTLISRKMDPASAHRDAELHAKHRNTMDAARVAAPRRWHRWLRLQAIPDIHGVYDFFRDLTVHGKPLRVVSWPSTRFHVYWPRPLKKAVPALNHVAMLAALLRPARGRITLVREFDNFWLLLLAPVLWWMRGRLVLNVNQNFSAPLGRGLRGWSLRVLARLGFRFLWLDGAAALDDVRPHFPRLQLSTPLFPVPRRACDAPQRDDDGFTVGLVGYFREDKGGVARAVALAKELATIPGVRVAAGFWNDAQREEFSACAGPRIETCSTYETADYHGFLARCDAVVVLAERESYYYRHSGILMDCIGHRTIPVCPAYPLLASIVTRPVPVGAVYGESESLRCVVQRILAQRERLRANFPAHAAARAAGQVGAALEELLLPGGGRRAGTGRTEKSA